MSIQIVDKPLTPNQRIRIAELIQWAIQHDVRGELEARAMLRVLEPLCEHVPPPNVPVVDDDPNHEIEPSRSDVREAEALAYVRAGLAIKLARALFTKNDARARRIQLVGSDDLIVGGYAFEPAVQKLLEVLEQEGVCP